MQMFENVYLAIEGLRANKVRALLTMLGIIIGIGSVIAIVTVGDSMTASVSSSMQELGATNIMVRVQSRESNIAAMQMGGGMPTMTENDLISDEMIEIYESLYGDSIKAVSTSMSAGSGKVTEGKLYANVTLNGTNEGYGLVNNIEITEGRYIRDGDLKTGRYVAVVSNRLVQNMFPSGTDPLGKEIKLNHRENILTFTIVGVYEYKQGIMSDFSTSSEKDIRTDMYIPITTCGRITSANKGHQMVTVMAESGVNMEPFSRTTRDFFNTFYANNLQFRVGTMNMETVMSTMTTMMGTLSIAVAVIAGISLLVGGIGVMNIMLVSVTERTREIGTRKALGARDSAIRIQFIVEAAIICAIGGVFGVILGVSAGYLASYLLGFAGFPSMFIIIVAVLFSMMIGVFFGYYPANKAAMLDPIEALRYE